MSSRIVFYKGPRHGRSAEVHELAARIRMPVPASVFDAINGRPVFDCVTYRRTDAVIRGMRVYEFEPAR